MSAAGRDRLLAALDPQDAVDLGVALAIAWRLDEFGVAGLLAELVEKRTEAVKAGGGRTTVPHSIGRVS